MKFWLATANQEEAEQLLPFGFFEGIITNPTIVAKEKDNPKILFSRLCPLVDCLYYQIGDSSYDQMMKEADLLISVNPEKIRLKIPGTKEGFRVMRTLADQNMAPMATVVPTVALMVLAAAAGANAVAPYSRSVQKKGIATKSEEILRMQHVIDAQHMDLKLCTGIYDITDISFYAYHGVASGFIFPKDVVAFMNQPMVTESCRAYDNDLKLLHEFLFKN